jgi:hypothetical protein
MVNLLRPKYCSGDIVRVFSVPPPIEQNMPDFFVKLVGRTIGKPLRVDRVARSGLLKPSLICSP